MPISPVGLGIKHRGVAPVAGHAVTLKIGDVLCQRCGAVLRTFMPSDTCHDSNPALARCAAHSGNRPTPARGFAAAAAAFQTGSPRTRMTRLVSGTLDLSRQLLTSPSRRCTAVPASSRSNPKFIVVAAHFEGARRLRGRFPGVWEALYGRLCPVPYGIISLQQPHKGQVLALLLSCPPILPSRSNTRLPAVPFRHDARTVRDALV